MSPLAALGLGVIAFFFGLFTGALLRQVDGSDWGEVTRNDDQAPDRIPGFTSGAEEEVPDFLRRQAD